MSHSNQELFQEIIKLNTVVKFQRLKNQKPILRNYLSFLKQKVNKEFGSFVERLLINIQLEADEQNFNANSQNFLELKRNTTATITSSNIFQNSERPKKTSEGIVVINAIGMNTLKNILRENENVFKGNLPM